ncbi:MAG: hypothetical protein H7319_17615 [Spirosoma sp.]|nr:hypothetical protein [Spirosoma sp.]
MAFEQFKGSLDLASALKRLERDYPPNPKLEQQPYVKGLRGGAAVLMVAAFEFFLRKLFEENISKLNAIPALIEFSKLPEQLRVKAVFHTLQMAMDGPKYSEKTAKIDRIEQILQVCKLIISEQVHPETFSETGSNPNSETVKVKFKEIGVPDIFGKIKSAFVIKWGAPVADSFIKDKLDEIVRTRHVVAHTADTLNITRKSQNDAFRFLKILAELLEKEMENHIKALLVSAKK